MRRVGVEIVDSHRVAHEVKSGYVRYQSSIIRQIERDAILARTEENGIKYVIHLP